MGGIKFSKGHRPKQEILQNGNLLAGPSVSPSVCPMESS